MMPFPVLLFGVSPTIAVGTDLLFAALTKVARVSVHGLRGTVDRTVARRLAFGRLPAAALTGALMYQLPRESFQVDRLVMQALGVMLLLTAGGLLAKNRLHGVGRHLRLKSAGTFKHVQPTLTVLAPGCFSASW